MFNDLPGFGYLPGRGGVGKTMIDAAVTVEPAARAATKAPEIATARNTLATCHAVVPMLTDDPVGAHRLRALVGRAPAIA